MNHRSNISSVRVLLCLIVSLIGSLSVSGQSLTAGTVTGTVVDPNSAIVPSATVTLSNPVTGYKRTLTTGADGGFQFNDVPPNNYQLSVSASGFEPATQTLQVRTSVPISLKIPLAIDRKRTRLNSSQILL